MPVDVSMAALKSSDGLYARKVTKSFALPIWQAEDSSKRNVLNEIDFVVRPGEITGLVGRTGVGKTTLGKVLGGLYRVDSGSVSIGSHDISRINGRQARMVRRMLRYVPQNPDAVLFESATVHMAMKEAQSISCLSPEETQRWSERVLARPLFKKSWLDRKYGELSLGERRRVINLRSLQSCPRFLIMDEPFNGLDLNTRGAMLKLLRVSAEEHGTGILIISHDVPALREVCDRIKLLSEKGIRSYQPEKKKK